MPIKNDFYTYKIIWSEDDNEFVGLCSEFPSLSWLSKTQESALKGIKTLVSEVVQDMKISGEATPEPIATKKYSGKISLRVSPEIHRNIAVHAAESGLSINKLICYYLSNQFKIINNFH